MELKVGDRFYLPCTVVGEEDVLADFEILGLPKPAEPITIWKEDLEKVAMPIEPFEEE